MTVKVLIVGDASPEMRERIVKALHGKAEVVIFSENKEDAAIHAEEGITIASCEETIKILDQMEAYDAINERLNRKNILISGGASMAMAASKALIAECLHKEPGVQPRKQAMKPIWRRQEKQRQQKMRAKMNNKSSKNYKHRKR